jgi:SRSO17 transposase
MWLPSGQLIRTNKWREFERVFDTGEREKREIRVVAK